MEHMTKIICDLLEQMNKLEEDSLKSLSGLTPTLSSCIQVNNARVRDIVTSDDMWRVDTLITMAIRDKDIKFTRNLARLLQCILSLGQEYFGESSFYSQTSQSNHR